MFTDLWPPGLGGALGVRRAPFERSQQAAQSSTQIIKIKDDKQIYHSFRNA